MKTAANLCVTCLLGLLASCVGDRAATSKTAPKDAAPSSLTVDAGKPAPVTAVDPAALIKDARTALDAGDHVKARALLTQAEAIPSSRVQAAVMLAESHLSDDGDFSAVTPALERALAQSPDDVDAQWMMGRVKEATGQAAEARVFYAKVSSSRPADGAVAERLASVALTQATQAQAQKDDVTVKSAAQAALDAFGKARAVSGDKPAYAMGEARARELLGDLPGAEAALRHLLELSGNAPGPRVLLVDFYERHHQQAKADKERKAAGTEVTPQKRKLRPLQPGR